MKNRKLVIALSIIFAAVVLTGVGVYAATAYGTQSDPLITLSYLTDSLQPALLSEVESEVDAAAGKLEEAFEKALAQAGSISVDTYMVVSLSSGQTLTGEVGCEIMLREGSARVSALSSPGILDSSGGSTLEDGAAVTVNHLYMVSDDGNGVTATSSVKLLVRGTYSIS